MSIFHRHRYKIMGTGDLDKQAFTVDVICKCGKVGMLMVPIKYKKRVMKQAVKGRYLNVACVVWGEVLNGQNL